MLATRALCGMPSRCLPTCLLLLVFAGTASADPKPLSKEEQAKVDKAIEKAVIFVKNSQKDTGEFGKLLYPENSGLYFNRGSYFFPALALLESGVPASDPSIQKTATLVRDWVPQMDRTFEVSVALLFLDRLGDPRDKERLRSLALRLIAAQTYTGGWGYYCPLLSEQNEIELWKTLSVMQVKDSPHSSRRDEKSPAYHNTNHVKPVVPQRLRALAIFRDPNYLFPRAELRIREESPPPDLDRSFVIGLTENCNTQLAMLALWAASRHDIPVDRTLNIVAKRFVKTQNKDGTWNYRYTIGHTSKEAKSSMSNTATGLLGLAMAYGTGKSPGKSVDSDIQERMTKGLIALSKEIGRPNSQMDHRVPMKDLYYLWSIECVGTLYNISVIDGKDWYRWGVEVLVTNQNDDGTWMDRGRSYFNMAVNPSFALLFLKRANLTRELTSKLPFTAKELNESIDRSRSSYSRQLEGSTESSSRFKKTDH